MKKTPLTLAAALIIAATPLQAGQGERGEDFRFRYDSRILNTAEGAEAEYGRLKRAVRRYCRTDGRDARSKRWARGCQVYTMTECERQMPSQLLAFLREEAEERG